MLLVVVVDVGQQDRWWCACGAASFTWLLGRLRQRSSMGLAKSWSDMAAEFGGCHGW